MIINILEKMKSLRENGDYANYRTMSNILSDEIRQEILNKPSVCKMNLAEACDTGMGKLIMDVINGLLDETNCLTKIFELKLKNDDYASCKIVSQSKDKLIQMLGRLEGLKEYIINR